MFPICTRSNGSLEATPNCPQRYASRFLLISLNIDSILQEDGLSQATKGQRNGQCLEIGGCLRCNIRSDKGAGWREIEAWNGHSSIRVLLVCYQGLVLLIRFTLKSISGLILSLLVQLTRQLQKSP